MVLDDDVNGFRGNPKRKGGGGKKNKKVRIIIFLLEFMPRISFRIKIYSNWLCGILPSLMIQADRMITMSTKLGNAGNTKKG